MEGVIYEVTPLLSLNWGPDRSVVSRTFVGGKRWMYLGHEDHGVGLEGGDTGGGT